jgi:hypothetical protein
LGNDGALVPILGGIAGGVATVYGAEKFGLSPVAAAGVGVAGGLGIRSAVKSPMMKNAMLGVAIGAGTLGGLHLVANVRAAQATQPKPSANTQHGGKRQAEGGDGFVTQQQLNDALGKVADQHKETCDLMTALRAEIRSVVAGDDTHVRTTNPVRSPGPMPGGVPHLYTLYPTTRGAAIDDERNAYVEDEYMRNAYSDEERNAYVEDERNAYVEDEYMRNAYSDDERNAFVDEERNAFVDDERNAYVDDERNADVEST